jgi:hypothetical protein
MNYKMNKGLTGCNPYKTNEKNFEVFLNPNKQYSKNS